jgi:hypothetical protein
MKEKERDGGGFLSLATFNRMFAHFSVFERLHILDVLEKYEVCREVFI